MLRCFVSRARWAVGVSLFSFATGVVAPSIALAQKAPAATGGPTAKEVATAKKAFFDGIDLEKANKWPEALEKFEEVKKVRMSPAVRFHIALCYEHLNRLVEALHEFETAESGAKAEKVPKVGEESAAHIAAIRPKIPKLKLVVEKIDGIAITVLIDTRTVDPNEEILLDPGKHRIEAMAEKRKNFGLDFELAESESKTIPIKLARDEPDKPPEVEEEPVKPPPPPSSSNTGAWVVGGVGVASLIGAGVFFAMRGSVNTDLESSCVNLICPTNKEDAIKSGKTYTLMTNIFGVIGILGVGTSIVLFATGKSTPADAKPSDSKPVDKGEKKEMRRKLELLPASPGADLAGLSLRGTF